MTETVERIGRGIAFIEAHPFERPSLAAIAERSRTVPNRRGRHTLGICVDADPATVEQDIDVFVPIAEVTP
jgi:hypothetical protein